MVADADDTTMTPDLLAAFHAKYPNVTFKRQYTGWDDYLKSIDTTMSADSAPDIAQYVSGMNNLVKGRLLLDVGAYAKAYGWPGKFPGLDQITFSSDGRTTGTGALYGVPGLYAAFGSKAGLFEEAVRTYAERYREIYRQAAAEKDIQTVFERVLIDSVHEFTQPGDAHPGCLIISAVMADSTSTLDTSAYLAELHSAYEQALLVRVERAIRDGQLAAGTDASALTGLVQSLWHGLSVRSNADASREELLATARLAHGLICRQPAPPPAGHAGCR
ncbi:extracellular solute-binding protein [Streptomyces sp. NPDC001100]